MAATWREKAAPGLQMGHQLSDSSPVSMFMFILHVHLHIPFHCTHILQAGALFHVVETSHMSYNLSNSLIPAQCVQVILLHFIALSVFMLHVHLQYLSIAHIEHTACTRRASGSPKPLQASMVCKLSSCTSHPRQNYLSCIGD